MTEQDLRTEYELLGLGPNTPPKEAEAIISRSAIRPELKERILQTYQQPKEQRQEIITRLLQKEKAQKANMAVKRQQTARQQREAEEKKKAEAEEKEEKSAQSPELISIELPDFASVHGKEITKNMGNRIDPDTGKPALYEWDAVVSMATLTIQAGTLKYETKENTWTMTPTNQEDAPKLLKEMTSIIQQSRESTLRLDTFSSTQMITIGEDCTISQRALAWIQAKREGLSTTLNQSDNKITPKDLGVDQKTIEKASQVLGISESEQRTLFKSLETAPNPFKMVPTPMG